MARRFRWPGEKLPGEKRLPAAGSMRSPCLGSPCLRGRTWGRRIGGDGEAEVEGEVSFVIVMAQRSGQVGELIIYWRLGSSHTHPQQTDGDSYKAKGELGWDFNIPSRSLSGAF